MVVDRKYWLYFRSVIRLANFVYFEVCLSTTFVRRPAASSRCPTVLSTACFVALRVFSYTSLVFSAADFNNSPVFSAPIGLVFARILTISLNFLFVELVISEK